jgi:predicted nuclease with TOPRIM domain
MKYFLLIVAILMLGCSMPGVGELEERVDELESTAAYDDSDLVERVEYVEDEVIVLDERVTNLEMVGTVEVPDIHTPATTTQQVVTQPEEQPEPVTGPEPVIMNIDDVEGLDDALGMLETSLRDSIQTLDGSLYQLTLRIDSLETENDSLKAQLDELSETVQDLSSTVSSLRSTSYSSSSSGSSSHSGGAGVR